MKNKISSAKEQKKAYRREAPIPFERHEPTAKLGKDHFVQFKLHVDPNDITSTQYELNVAYFQSGPPERYIRFLRDLQKVIDSTSNTTVSKKFLLTRKLLQGDALAKFEAAARQYEGEADDERYSKCMQALALYVFPITALKMQGLCMQYYMRKDKKVKAREYVNRLVELNDYLREFPGFEREKHLFEDIELLAILEYGIPGKWNSKFFELGYDPLKDTLEKFVEMCERQEAAEQEERPKATSAGNQKQSHEDGDDAKDSSEKKKRTFRGGGEKRPWCVYHEDYGHSTKDCHVLKRLKEERPSKRNKQENRDYGAPREKKAAYKKEELHTMVSEAIKREMKKAYSGKKRKEHVGVLEEQFDELTVEVKSDVNEEDHTQDTFASLEDRSPAEFNDSSDSE